VGEYFGKKRKDKKKISSLKVQLPHETLNLKQKKQNYEYTPSYLFPIDKPFCCHVAIDGLYLK
jgi:hypothetical protein